MATLPEVISNGELPVLDDWEPLSRKRILRYFDRSLEYADVSAYVSAQGELLPDERIILVFLNAVYTQSLATVELYCRYVVELLNYARKPSFSVTARDVESYIRQCRMKGLKPRSVNTIIGALKSYFKRLADTGATVSVEAGMWNMAVFIFFYVNFIFHGYVVYGWGMPATLGLFALTFLANYTILRVFKLIGPKRF